MFVYEFVRVFIDFVGPVDLQKLVKHMVQLFAIVRVRLHSIFEGSHDAYYLAFELALLRCVLCAVFVHIHWELYIIPPLILAPVEKK